MWEHIGQKKNAKVLVFPKRKNTKNDIVFGAPTVRRPSLLFVGMLEKKTTRGAKIYCKCLHGARGHRREQKAGRGKPGRAGEDAGRRLGAAGHFG